MSKRLLSIILAISLVFSMTTVVFGNSGHNFGVELNNTEAFLEEEVYLNEKGQVMYPLREFAEKLGYEVTWDGKDRSVTLSKETDVVKLQIEQTSITANNESISLSTTPVIRGNKTFVPLEFFSEALNLIVGWDSKSQNIKISEYKKNTEPYFNPHENKDVGNKLNTYMGALQELQNFHGSILVAKEGKVLLNEGYGFADFQQNTMIKSQTKFAIGSVTKQFTAMGIMQLNEKGLLSVEDKISKYISGISAGDSITIHNLLTHTSGLPNFTDLVEFYYLNQDNKDPMAVVDIIKDKPLYFKPGEAFSYSNTNYLLLGMIIEKVSGLSYEAYLQENIFDVLNMNNTGVCYGEDDKIYDATAYVGYLDVIPVDDEILLKHAHGAGNMYSTVEDLYRWDQALKTEQLVKKETLNKIFTGYTIFPGAGNYGYGWIISDTDLGKVIWHNGATLGFTANIARYIDQDFTILILTNNRHYDTTALTNTLASIAFNKDYKMPEIIKEIKIDDPNLYESYVGQYEMSPGVYIDIIEKDNNIYAQLTGQDAFEIFPQTTSQFFSRIIDLRIEFIKNDKGEVRELTLEQMGVKIVAKNTKYKEDRVTAVVDPKIYSKYVGEYELVPGMLITILQEDNKIYAKLTGQDQYEIFPMSEKEYFYKIVDAQITFVEDDKGQITNLILHQNGQDMPAYKIK